MDELYRRLEDVADVLPDGFAVIAGVCDASGQIVDLIVRDPGGTASAVGSGDAAEGAGPLLGALQTVEAQLAALGPANGRPAAPAASSSQALVATASGEQELQRAYEDLSRREELYRSMIERSPTVIARLGPEGAYRYVSPAVRTMLGFEPHELIGRTALELVHHDDYDQLSSVWWTLNTPTTDLLTIEVRHKRKDGSHIWVESDLRAIRDPATGRTKEVHVEMWDVTHTRASHESLRVSEQRLRHVFESSQFGLAFLSATPGSEGLVLEANDAFAAITRTTPGTLAGRSIESILPAEQAERVLAAVRNGTAVPKEGVVIELPGADEDGGAAWLEAHLWLEHDAADHPQFATLRVRDVTEPRRAYVALERRAESLRDSNRELEQFARIAAHELAAPLRAISGFAELILHGEHELDGDAHDLLSRIRMSAERMQTTVDQLLTYAAAGGDPLARGPVDTNAVIQEVLTVLTDEIRESGAAVGCDELPVVRADEIQLERVFRNLISNAIKFCDEDKPRVHVSAAREADAWCFSVIDNGIGIDPADAERAFHMFGRLGSHASASGTGIGLAVCRKIVEHHGGRIWAQPNPLGGTAVRFTIPDSSPAR